MNYEKKYKQLYKFITDLYPHMSEYCKEKVEGFFPELAESEDERIRTWLEEHIEAMPDNSIEFKDVKRIDVLHWLEKQGEQNLANSAKTCKENKEIWSKEDERLCRCLIKDQKKALNEVRNDKYGHSEIISDLKEMYNERITWLKSLKEKLVVK